MDVLYKKPWDDSQYHKTFCPKCFFYLWSDTIVGCNYCPNCGIDLQWKPGQYPGFNYTLAMSQQLKEYYNKEEEH